jgi:hypothetical protein
LEPVCVPKTPRDFAGEANQKESAIARLAKPLGVRSYRSANLSNSSLLAPGRGANAATNAGQRRLNLFVISRTR